MPLELEAITVPAVHPRRDVRLDRFLLLPCVSRGWATLRSSCSSVLMLAFGCWGDMHELLQTLARMAVHH